MAERIRSFDWAKTALGPARRWPESLRAVADMALASPLGMIVLWGPELIQIYNDAYRNVMGAKHPAGLGQPTQDCWPEVWTFNAPIYDAVFHGEARSFIGQKLTISRHDGTPEEAWFDLSYSGLRDERGCVAGVLVTVVETSAQHQAMAALRESERRFRAFVTATSDVVYRMSPDWAVMRELDGVGFLADTQQPRGGWLMTYIPEEERARVSAEIEASIRGRTVFELEHKVVRADGTIGWTLSRAVPILDEVGEVVDWLGSAKDVTRRKEAEAALRRSEGLRAIAVAGGRLGTWRWDTQARSIWGDAAFLALWAILPSDTPYPISVFLSRMALSSRADLLALVARPIKAGEEVDIATDAVIDRAGKRRIRWRGRADRDRPWIIDGVSFCDQPQASPGDGIHPALGDGP